MGAKINDKGEVKLYLISNVLDRNHVEPLGTAAPKYATNLSQKTSRAVTLHTPTLKTIKITIIHPYHVDITNKPF